MPVAVGPHGQSQASCFDHVKMGFVTGCAMGMAAGVPFGNFSCLGIGMRGSGADGRHRKNHDAEWQHLWHIHGHWDGHPMLIRAVVAHNMHPLPSVPSHVYYNKASLWVKKKKKKKQESSRKTSVSALLTMPKPLTVWITINCGQFWKR